MASGDVGQDEQGGHQMSDEQQEKRVRFNMSEEEDGKINASGRWPTGTLASVDGNYEVTLTTFSKEKMLESVTSGEIIDVLHSSKELNRVKKTAVLKFLRKRGSLKDMEVATLLPKLQDKDLFQIIADNKDIESKLNINAVCRVIKRAGRHAAVMRFTRANMIKLFVEARLKAYLSVGELKFYAGNRVNVVANLDGSLKRPLTPNRHLLRAHNNPRRSIGKRPTTAPGIRPPKSPRGADTGPAKMAILNKMTRKQLMFLLTKEKLTEKMPHGALLKAVKSMTRADALACIGASDLKRILIQQGLMAAIQVDHIFKHLKLHKMLRIFPREVVDSVIAEFDLHINMEQLINVVLAGKNDSEEDSNEKTTGFSLSALQEMVQEKQSNGKSMVRVVHMLFSKTSGVDVGKELSIYGIAEEASPILAVCNTGSLVSFIFEGDQPSNAAIEKKSEEEEKNTSDKKPEEKKTDTASERKKPEEKETNAVSEKGGKTNAASEKKQKAKKNTNSSKKASKKDASSETVKLFAPVREGRSDTSDSLALPPMLLGAFLWDWANNALSLIARRHDKSHYLITHQAKDSQTMPIRPKDWTLPSGFYNDQYEKITLSVELLDESLLKTEASRIGLLPSEEHWNKLENLSKEKLTQILASPELSNFVSKESIVSIVESKALQEAIQNEIEKELKDSVKDIDVRRPKCSSILTSFVCKEARKMGIDSIIARMSPNSILNMLKSSNAIDYLDESEIKSLNCTNPEKKWRTAFKNLNKRHRLLQALSLRDVAGAVEQMQIREIMKLAQLSDPRNTLLDLGLTQLFPMKLLLSALTKEQMLKLMRRLDGAAVVTAAFGMKAVDTKIVIEELFFRPSKENLVNRRLKGAAASLLECAEISSSTKLFQFTISDAEKQKGTSFTGVLNMSSLFCFVDMDTRAFKYVRKICPGVVPGLLVWNGKKQKFVMIAQDQTTTAVELAADTEDFSKFSFEDTGLLEGYIGKWKQIA